MRVISCGRTALRGKQRRIRPLRPIHHGATTISLILGLTSITKVRKRRKPQKRLAVLAHNKVRDRSRIKPPATKHPASKPQPLKRRPQNPRDIANPPLTNSPQPTQVSRATPTTKPLIKQLRLRRTSRPTAKIQPTIGPTHHHHPAPSHRQHQLPPCPNRLPIPI